MAISAERLRVDVEANVKGAQRELAKVSGDSGGGGLKGLVGAAGAAKAAIAGMAGAAAVSLATKTVMAASDLNEQVSKTGVVFGKSAEKVIGDAQRMADKFGTPKTEFLEAASAIGLVGKASGLTQAQAAGMSTQMAELAQDAASFYNVPLTDALDAMKSGLVGEAEPMRRFGVLLNEGAVQAEALRLGLVKPIKSTEDLKAAQVRARLAQEAYTKAVKDHGKGSAEAQKANLALKSAQDAVTKAAKGVVPPLTEGQKVQARSSLIIKGMADAHGDLERTQSSVANRVRELQGRLTNMAADMGTKALPAAAALLGGLIAMGTGIGKVTGFLNEHKTALKIVTGLIVGLFLPAIVKAGVSSTVSAAKQVAAWATSAAGAARSAAAQWAASVKVVAGWVASGAAAVKSGAQTVAIWALYKAEAVKGAAVWVAQQARIAAASVATAAKNTAVMAASVARTVAGWVLMGVQALANAARIAAAWVIAMGPVGWAIAALVGIGLAFVALWKKSETFRSIVTGVMKAVQRSIGNAGGFIIQAFHSWLSVWLTVADGIISGAAKALGWIPGLGGKLKRANEAFDRMRAGIDRTMSGMADAAYGWGEDTAQGMANGISAKSYAAVAAAGDMANKVAAQARYVLDEHSPSRVFHKIGSFVSEGLARGIRSGEQGVTGALDAILAKVTDKANKVPAKIQDAIKAAIAKARPGLTRLARELDQTREAFGNIYGSNGQVDLTGMTGATAAETAAVASLTQQLEAAKAAADAIQVPTVDASTTVADRLAAPGIQASKDQANAKVADLQRQLDAAQSAADTLTASDVVANLQADAQKAAQFQTDLANLAKMGLSDQQIADLSQRGYQAAGATARALVAGGQATVQQVNALTQQISASGLKVAATGSAAFYDAGAQTARGLAAGFRDQREDLEKAMLHMARRMKRAIRKALGIQSPSRVMREVGRFAGMGLEKGLAASVRPVESQAGRLARAAVPDLPAAPGGFLGADRATARASLAGVGAGATFIFHAYNPVAEAQSVTTNKGLQRAADLGLV